MRMGLPGLLNFRYIFMHLLPSGLVSVGSVCTLKVLMITLLFKVVLGSCGGWCSEMAFSFSAAVAERPVVCSAGYLWRRHSEMLPLENHIAFGGEVCCSFWGWSLSLFGFSVLICAFYCHHIVHHLLSVSAHVRKCTRRIAFILAYLLKMAFVVLMPGLISPLEWEDLHSLSLKGPLLCHEESLHCCCLLQLTVFEATSICCRELTQLCLCCHCPVATEDHVWHLL